VFWKKRSRRSSITSRAVGVALFAGTGVLLGCGSPQESVTTDGAESPISTAASRPATQRAPTRAARTTGASASASVTYRTVTATQKIPFATRTVKDPSLAEGTTRVRTRGRAGVATLTYRVELIDGVEQSHTLVKKAVTTAPVTQVTVVGTKASSCDPNYGGACVPIASDVDCAGGGGNGPAYVQGPVTVIGSDIYGLDRDGNGIGCE
jgi:hypothetical protein